MLSLSSGEIITTGTFPPMKQLAVVFFLAMLCEDEQCVCARGGEKKAAVASPSFRGPFARLPVNFAELARWFGNANVSCPPALFQTPPHIFLHIRWRLCDLSAVGNICAFCHSGIKAFLLSRWRGTIGKGVEKPQELGATGAF